MKFPYDKPTVDFADFFIDRFNYDEAKELCNILMSKLNYDELYGFHNNEELPYESSVGTAGMCWHVATIAQQRALLAGNFASYGTKQLRHCYLGLPEYECLKNLLLELEDDYPPQHLEKIIQIQIDLLKSVINEFEKEYVKVDPNFLFTMLKK